MTIVDTKTSGGTVVKNACEAEWETWKSDCSGFVKAVADRLSISLSGNANALVDLMSRPPWKQLGNDASQASTLAFRDYFVIAGLKERGHGHVVIIVAGSGSYPLAYWGKLHSVGRKATTINYSWTKADLKKVSFFYYPFPVVTSS